MEFFLDTFDENEIIKYRAFVAGITTNPTVVRRDLTKKYGDCNEDYYNAELENILQHDIIVNIQVKDSTYSDMIAEGVALTSLSEKVVVKVPITFDGLIAIAELAALGVTTNATLCFSLFQAKMAIDAGATYISPFLGRMQDASIDIEKYMKNLRSIASSNLERSSKILAASIRNLDHIELAMVYADAITLTPDKFRGMFDLQLIQDGRQAFAKDEIRQ